MSLPVSSSLVVDKTAMKHLLAILLLLTVCLTCGIAGARTLAASPGPSPIQRTTRCLLPCWRGIQPGQTLIEQANGVFLGEGYNTQRSPQSRSSIYYEPVPPERECSVRLQQRDAVVTETRLTDCDGLQLGHIVLALGQPDYLTPNFVVYRFPRGIVRLRLEARDCADRLSPYTSISYISLSADDTPPDESASWLGFAPNWRYFRTAPHIPPLAC